MTEGQTLTDLVESLTEEIEKLKKENIFLRRKNNTDRQAAKEEVQAKVEEVERITGEWNKAKLEAVEYRKDLTVCEQITAELNAKIKLLEAVPPAAPLPPLDEVRNNLKVSREVNDQAIRLLKETQAEVEQIRKEAQALRGEYETFKTEHKAHVATIVTANEKMTEIIKERDQTIAELKAVNADNLAKLAKAEAILRKLNVKRVGVL